MSSKKPDIQYLANLYIGGRIKERRHILGISQADLGTIIGVTFQQVQKYEKAANRVSVGVLFHIAQILDVDLNWFVQGFDDNGDQMQADISSRVNELENLLKNRHQIVKTANHLSALLKS